MMFMRRDSSTKFKKYYIKIKIEKNLGMASLHRTLFSVKGKKRVLK